VDSPLASLEHEVMTFSPPARTRRGTLKPIAESECWELLDTTTVGRLAFTGEDGIVILPVNFLVHERRIYVRTEPGSTIATLADGRDDVAFEIDYHDGWNQFGWNVLVRGSTAEVGTLEAERAIASSGRLGPWAPGNRSLVIGLTPRAISGRRVSMR
jgi:nitroimidazol reductase NimA-like FMN-containing flavoprotein (pyridoxamine 5'-phosphate oxidase superfamily)